MHTSIRIRTILALNAFVISLSLILGWVARETAGRVVEERFARDTVEGVSQLLRTRRLPLSNTMMQYLHQTHNAEWVALRDGASEAAASSLDAEQTGKFVAIARGMSGAGMLELAGKQYRADSAVLAGLGGQADAGVSYRLYVLVPDSQFQETRNAAAARITAVMIPAAVVATALAVLLAVSITRPIRKLAAQMDRLETEPDSAGPPEQLQGPKEIVRLAGSFHRLLDRLSAARQRLAQQERLATLGKVSLSVAHELRNPLSGIKMNVRVLKDHLDAAGGDPGVNAILREIDRMELYINELMSLAPGRRREAEQMDREPVKLSELAESVLTILSGRCNHARVDVRKEFPADEPVVSADAGRIRQAMMNLMVNAVEAMPTGGTMTLAVRAGPGTIEFSAADTGVGVHLPDGQNLFEAFVSGKPNGVGLGLYLCKQVVERHGGRIGYDSPTAGVGGARFWFELPLATPAAKATNE